MPLTQRRVFVLRVSRMRISELVWRKLRGQSLGAVQQHRRSAASCRPSQKNATVGSALLLDGSMQDTRSTPRLILIYPEPKGFMGLILPHCGCEAEMVHGISQQQTGEDGTSHLF